MECSRISIHIPQTLLHYTDEHADIQRTYIAVFNVVNFQVWQQERNVSYKRAAFPINARSISYKRAQHLL